MSDAAKKPTIRMRRVRPDEEAAQTAEKPARRPSRMAQEEIVVVADDDPRRERD